MNPIKIAVFVLMMNITQPTLAGTSPWYHYFALQGSSVISTTNPDKSGQYSGKVEYGADYLEQYGYGLGYEYSGISFQSGTIVNQHKLNASLWTMFSPDFISGRGTIIADAQLLNNNDNSQGTDRVSNLIVSARYVTPENQFSIMPTISLSQYPNQVDVKQSELEIGFAFNQQWDWLSAKSITIQLPDKTITGQQEYSAFNLSLTHYLKPSNTKRHLQSVTGHISFGERFYYVNTVTKGIYNLNETIDFSTGIDFNYRLNKQDQFLFGVGVEGYKIVASGDRYQLGYLYGRYQMNW